jgi:hypothetical protein
VSVVNVQTVVRRVPFTASVVVLILVLGVATGTLWSPLEDKSWYPDVAFGPPALLDGRWWTVVTGSLYALKPLQYVAILTFFVLPVSLCEWRLGTRRTAAVVVVFQAIGVIGGGYLMVALSSWTDWGWAQRTAQDLDVGFSAGALAAAMVVSADLRRPWRGRVRLGVLGYVLTSLTFLGYLYDVEHLVAVLLGLWVGPWIVGRRPSRTVAEWLRPGFTRRDLRMLTGGSFLWGAIIAVIGQVADRDGPFGPIGGDPESWWWVLAVVAVDLLIAWGLVRGRRTWWTLALVLTSISWLLGAATAAVIVSGGTSNSGLVWISVLFDTAQLAALVLGRSAFRNPGRRGLRRVGADRVGALPTDADRERARELLQRHGSSNRLAWMTTWPENRWWFTDDAVVAYQQSMGVTIGLCDPVGPDPLHVAERFIGAARDAGTLPCLFSCSSTVARWAQDQGWIAVQVAEEAIVDLPELEFVGKKWQDVRSAFNQAGKQDVETRMMRLADAPRGIRTQLRAISDEWVRDKGLPEMGFTLGGLEEAEDPDVWINVAVDADMTVHGVTSWMPIPGPDGQVRGWTLDLMRRLPGGFRYTMELLIASACREFKEQGYEVVSLSGAPLAHAGAGDSVVDRSVIDDVLTRAGDVLEPYYGFQSLQAFKAKFQPRYEPLFLVVADEAALPRVGIAVGRAYLADATLGQLLALTRGH